MSNTVPLTQNISAGIAKSLLGFPVCKEKKLKKKEGKPARQYTNKLGKMKFLKTWNIKYVFYNLHNFFDLYNYLTVYNF